MTTGAAAGNVHGWKSRELLDISEAAWIAMPQVLRDHSTRRLRSLLGTNVAIVTSVAAILGISAVAQTGTTPPWLRWLGNGTNSYSCSSRTCLLGEEAWFTNFTVAPGATVVNPSGEGPIVVRATGTCSVHGTISNSALGGNFGISGRGDVGGGGGGGGGGTAAGAWGSTTVVIQNIPIVNGGAGGDAGGQNGHNGRSTTINEWQMFISNGSDWPGGGGAGGTGGSNGGKGGNGGGPVILVCNTIDFTGTIDVRGGPGANAPANNKGAGGGGGGGYVLFAAVSFTANKGAILTTGGAGGSCNGHTNCGLGGTGGNGWSASVKIR